MEKNDGSDTCAKKNLATMSLTMDTTTQQVAIDLGGELDPALVKPATGDDYLGVIMPMRI